MERGTAPLTDPLMASTFPGAIGGFALEPGDAMAHLVSHLAFHPGQLDPHRPAVTRNPKGLGAVLVGGMSTARKLAGEGAPWSALTGTPHPREASMSPHPRTAVRALWIRLAPAVVCLAAAAAAPPPASAGELQVRFYPEKSLRAYELEPRRGFSSALLQNVAVVNGGSDAVTLDRLELELIAGDEVVQQHRLGLADLQQAVKRGQGIQTRGLLQLYAFQFRPDVLLGPGVKLTSDVTLQPGTALLVGHRYFAFNGAPQSLRVRAIGHGAAGQAVAAEASLPLIVGGTSTVEYHFPLQGTWFIGAGQALHDHHRWAVPEEFALDIARIGDQGRTHRGDGTHRTDYLDYGADVLAAADGLVTAAHDSLEEDDGMLLQPGESSDVYMQRIAGKQAELLGTDPRLAGGNYVVIRHANGEHSFYAHLARGSVRVHAGDAVTRGQPIARLGNSGLSTEPHLHFHVVDGPDPLMSAGVPVRFANVELPWAMEPRAIQSGDIVEAH